MSFNLGIVGATGITGEVTLRILEKCQFSGANLRLFAERHPASLDDIVLSAFWGLLRRNNW